MNFLRPCGGTGSIFFPVGTPPKGTCEFASKTCLKNCFTWKDKKWDEEFDIDEKEKVKIYNYFKTNSITKLCDTILNELEGLQTDILYWFQTGDCKNKDKSRVLKIMQILKKVDIKQIGFTRNIDLWYESPVRLFLTVDHKDEFKKIKKRHVLSPIAIPNYKTNTTKLYFVEEVMGKLLYIRKGTCGGSQGTYSYKDKYKKLDIEYYAQCKRCAKLMLGCFIK